MSTENQVFVTYMNLNGDYHMPETDGTSVVGDISDNPRLTSLNDFLGALSNCVQKNESVFLDAINQIAQHAHENPIKNVAIQITSKLIGKELEHTFKINL